MQEFLLTDILVNLNFANSAYRFVAVIEYIKSFDAIGQYRCYVRRSTGKWEIHDGITGKLQAKNVPQKNNEEKKSFLPTILCQSLNLRFFLFKDVILLNYFTFYLNMFI